MQGGVRRDLRLEGSSRAGTWHGLSVRGWCGGSSLLPHSDACLGEGCWMDVGAACLKPKSAHGEAMQQGCVTTVGSGTLGGRCHWDLLFARC